MLFCASGDGKFADSIGSTLRFRFAASLPCLLFGPAHSGPLRGQTQTKADDSASPTTLDSVCSVGDRRAKSSANIVSNMFAVSESFSSLTPFLGVS